MITIQGRLSLFPVQEPPVFSKEGWKYTYIVSVPIVSPDLMKISKNGIQGEQRLLKHRKKLIKSVTQSLIKTIKIK